jgi:shikimate kinase
MSYYIIIRGPLGVGKSTIAKALAKKLNAAYISIDTVLEQHGLDRKDDAFVPEDFIKVNRIILPTIKKHLQKNKIVILDGCFYFKEPIAHLKKELAFKCLIFSIKASLKTCIERDNNRRRVYGENAAKAVYSMVAKLKCGIDIQTDEKTEQQVVDEIISQLP